MISNYGGFMKSSVLFWGFQDLKLVAEVAKKLRSTLNIKDFYIQIQDLEKTVSLMDLYPEEIIRTKYDLNNLLQWLTRDSRNNGFIVIDLFSFPIQDNIEENYLSLTKILELDFKICFVTPKILYPQNLNFINNIELNYIYQNIIEYTGIIKNLYEIIINSKSDSTIFATPVSEMIVHNREEYFLFESKEKYKFSFVPKILKKYNGSYISQSSFVRNLIESISTTLSAENRSHEAVLTNVDADYNSSYCKVNKNTFSKFNFLIPVSLERFFKIKNTEELKYILWLMYLAICEHEVQVEKSQAVPKLAELFFSLSG